MAVNPYFTFADPALQQAVANEAQVAAALQAAQAQQRAATQAAMRQERQAASDREERRAIRMGDIARLDAQEAERRRQFDVNTKLTEKDIASREKISGVRTKEVDDRDLYNNLLKLVEGDDPPTLRELEARMVDLTDTRKQSLRDRRNATAAAKLRNFTASRAEAQRLAGLIGTIRDGKTLTADDVLRGSQWKGVLQVTPDGRGFESLLTPPREDAPEPEPPTPTFHVPGGRPPPDTYGGVEPVRDVLSRAMPTGFMRGAAEIGNAQNDSYLSRFGRVGADTLGRAISGLVPVGPPESSPGMLPGFSMSLPNMIRGGIGAGFYAPPPPPQGFYPRATDFRVPVEYPGGPLIDADTGEILAPPPFAPQY